MRTAPLVLALFVLQGSCKEPEGDDVVPTPPAGTPTADTSTEPVNDCIAPAPAVPRGGDATADAAAPGAWFRSVRVDRLTANLTTTGAAWVDLDRDGHLDVVITRDDAVEMLQGDGCFGFAPVEVEVEGGLGSGLGAPMAVDLDHDGWLDLYLPSEGLLDRAHLLMSDGAFDRFVEMAEPMGVDNRGAYVRGGASLGDLDDDGWFDFAVGGHQIGFGGPLGRPLSRLYRYRPAGAAGSPWTSGFFEDLGGTPAVPGFGGLEVLPCQPGSESTGLDLTLHDLDDDGALDLLWATHNDMYATTADQGCATGSNPYGLRLWRGSSAQEPAFVEVEEGPGAPVDKGRMSFDEGKGYYVVADEGPALGPELLTLFDPDRDGDLDLLAVGPTDPDWTVKSSQTVPGSPGRAAAFYRNDSGSFALATEEVGLSVLDWTIGQWGAFFDSPVPDSSPVMSSVCALGPQAPLCEALLPAERLPYPGQLLPLDADNDGAVDLLYVVRQCVYDVAQSEDDLRSVLLHNRGDGTYEPVVTELSGVVGCGLGAFAEDLDGDGWLDLHLLVRDQLQSNLGHVDIVLRNLGAQLAHGSHHWVQVRLGGLPEERLLGARILAKDAQGAIIASGWVEREAWRGSRDGTVHLGLGAHDEIRLEVRLRSGQEFLFDDPLLDREILLELAAR
jgi:hypothetical protein